MKSRLAYVLGALSAGVLGFALLPMARAQQATDSGVNAIAVRMMGGGMMGQPNGESQTPTGAVNSGQAKALISYVHGQNLTCFQCHAVSENGLVPSFDSVSAHYANRTDAKAILENHITYGVGEMPENLATEQQAKQLAGLILNLK